MIRSRHLSLFGVGLFTGLVLIASGCAGQQAPVPQSRAQAQAAESFEVASVRLSPAGAGYTVPPKWGTSRFTVRNATFDFLVQMAFDVRSDEITGKPGWFDSQRYDIDATVSGSVVLDYERAKPLLQQLLGERFRLKVHREAGSTRGYALVVAQKGPKLQLSKGPSADAYQGYILPDRLQLTNASLSSLAGMLAQVMKRPIVDMTALKDRYDITLQYAPEQAIDSPLPSIFTALQEQLGLKLEPRTVPSETLVIDHVERVPAEN